jgi:hypothetical protein
LTSQQDLGADERRQAGARGSMPRTLARLVSVLPCARRMEPKDLVAYVDVDDTLVRQTGTKRIPMVAVVEHVRQLHQAGVTLFCWSAGGAEYSRRTARELGIESLFTGFLPKPHVLLDDQPPSEWPNCIVAVPSGLASVTPHGHIDALARRERANKA